MPDYGHELRFGSFVTPIADRPQHVADLALLSEDEGLDLITVQDHPYQGRLLDAWTVLTWVAARTTAVHVSANVTNLPLRPPALLARSLAGLDLLSGGRAALGLGTGAFWDAIAAMGGPRRTPAEAVGALDEALDVIRGVWAGEDHGPLRAGGVHYRIDGAARGPSPAHDIPIWLGAFKPRMQRLIGRKGDGWLPSLPRLAPGDLARGNRVIDEAAARAGRDPRAITRLLNVTPGDKAEDLARLAADDGVSVFIVATDDPYELRRFARETAPEIRDRVAEARAANGGGPGAASSGSSPGPRSQSGGAPPGGGFPSEARSPEGGLSPGHRAGAVAFEGEPVPARLAARALTPGGPGHGRYTSTYFRGAVPGLVLRPRTPAEVQEAVRYAARHRGVPLGLLSGGHGLSGRSINDGGIVISLEALDEITVMDGGRVRIGPGARWGEVAARLAPHGLAITSGDYGGVGVGGLATAGGIGWFARQRGLTIDHLRAVELVTAGGELVRAGDEENADLFWAMRGAGANFGVAVAFEFDAHPVGDQVGFAMLAYVPDDLAGFLHGWGEAIENAHPSVSGSLMLGPAPAGYPAAVQALIMVDSADPDTVVERLRPLAGAAPLAGQSVRLTPYSALLAVPPGEEVQHGHGQPVSHSGLVRHLTPEVAARLADLMAARDRFILTIRSTGGAGVSPDATAYAWREANFLVATLGGASRDLADRWERLLPLFDGAYLSFETDTGPEALARAFPPGHLRRLRELKRRWDPTGLFRDNFPIDPAGS